MAENKEEYKIPAGMEDNDFGIISINLAKTENKESGLKAEKGPELSRNTIISTSMEEGVIIQAYTTERDGTLR